MNKLRIVSKASIGIGLKSIAIMALMMASQAQAQQRAIDLDTTALGQSAVENDARDSDSEHQTGQNQNDRDQWRFSVGGGFAIAPKFYGSDNYRFLVVPMAQASYGRFSFGASGVSASLYRDSHWQFRAHLSPSRGRDESDDPALRGLGNIDRSILAGVSASYRYQQFTGRLQINTDIANKKQGTQARLDLAVLMPVTNRLLISAGPGITWASGEYTQTFFGVTPTQSLNSGLPIFMADSGLNSVRLSVTALYRFDRHWHASASLSVSELEGDAAKSPITQSTTQALFFAGVIYRF